MNQLLQMFLLALERTNAKILDYFNPGLTKNKIKSILKAVDIDIPQEILNFYLWRDGINIIEAQKDTIEIWILPLGTIMSLSTAVERFMSLSGSNDYWKLSMFCFAESTLGDYYFVECDKTSSDYGKVLFYSPTNIEFKFVISAFDSLKAFFETITECYTNQIFFLNSDHLFEFDFAKYVEVLKKYNPNSNFWKLYV